jgi:hypothetical protein
MHFPPFWARGSHGSSVCWRWSDHSQEEAAGLAAVAARRQAERAAAVGWPTDRYGYGDRPLREPVLLEVKNDAGELAGVLTRNSYGCVVLNTARVMFVDVDLAEPGAAAAQSLALDRAEAWIRSHPGWGWRAYRTRAGLRFLATHALFEPERVLSEPVFDHLGADPLYRQLCKSQACFRARLTPKPWRCGADLPPVRWPFADAAAEAEFARWEIDYRARSSGFATCAFLASLGSDAVHPEVALLMAVHDQATRLDASPKLA